MVRRFYSDVAQDDLLGPIFNTVARVDWSEHLPKLTDYWCRLLFGLPGYAGNPLRAHQLVHEKSAFTDRHFERWLDLFCETIDLGWTGPNTEKAKEFAVRVARAARPAAAVTKAVSYHDSESTPDSERAEDHLA